LYNLDLFVLDVNLQSKQRPYKSDPNQFFPIEKAMFIMAIRSLKPLLRWPVGVLDGGLGSACHGQVDSRAVVAVALVLQLPVALDPLPAARTPAKQ
jgi:hypothetical protein